MTDAVTPADYERLAADVLPGPVYDFVAGGSGTESAVRRNRAALDAVTVTPRVLAGVAEPDLSCSLFGTHAAMPVAVAPMAYQRLLHPDGELRLARAAAEAGIPYTISMLSSFPLEEIAKTAPSWFQLYWLRDRATVEALIDRAVTAGCQALVITVDVPVMGRRLRDVRNAFALPPEVVAANLVDMTTQAHDAVPGLSAVAAHTASAFDPALGWADLEWLRRRSPIPLVVKGILDPRDARRAVDTGADGVVVSNHGGRQFDAAPAAIDALTEIAATVGEDCTVLLDSGVRTGLDVLKAIACGADAVLLGRPLLWALAVDAAEEALQLLYDELRAALMLTGSADLPAVAGLTTGRQPWPTSD